ncbi:TPA: hypothetical protein KKM77_005219 [Escherichia coli]|uniref:hypothetical protein n=1 Tax=Escherichia coli TaxID=562 RepID=UPI0015817345|nr:hypothetical protein [Escherichia coli]MDA6771028.1 hypothetical protein [Escherichia coli]MDO2500413.1 hypothetical protein [Escherichia coli]MDO2552286.1 hypothetical protein [Escherichia coli]MDO2596553.1 hypothetical protein [Escherichia coli]MDO2895741.1 hypothetical protein [Escherichia coli]
MYLSQPSIHYLILSEIASQKMRISKKQDTNNHGTNIMNINTLNRQKKESVKLTPAERAGMSEGEWQKAIELGAPQKTENKAR